MCGVEFDMDFGRKCLCMFVWAICSLFQNLHSMEMMKRNWATGDAMSRFANFRHTICVYVYVWPRPD